MYVADLSLRISHRDDERSTLERLTLLLGALRKNGQILGDEHPIALQNDQLRVTVLVPERSSLDEEHANVYVRQRWAEIREAGVGDLEILLASGENEQATACECGRPSAFVLFTTYVSLAPPLRCWDHFDPVPLYRVSPAPYGDHYDLISWESDYQACDRLQMNCATGERFAIREMSDINSSLMRRARGVCWRIEQNTDVPTYAYLYRMSGRSLARERRRRCPGCDGEWLLADLRGPEIAWVQIGPVHVDE